MKQVICKRAYVACCAVALLLSASGCHRPELVPDSGSEGGRSAGAVSFRTGGASHTKVGYRSFLSGEMDWSLNDVMLILYGESDRNPKHAEYKVTSVSADRASIAPAQDGGGVFWNRTSDTHHFYGLYPVPSSGNGGGLDDEKITISIPAVQGFSGNTRTSGDTLFVEPVFTAGAWLYAQRVVSGQQQGVIDLAFYPMFTAATVVLDRGDNSEVTVNSFRVTSRQHPVSGSGTISHATPDVFTASAASGGITDAKVENLDVTLSGGIRKIALTLFLLPHPYGEKDVNTAPVNEPGSDDEDVLTIHFNTTINSVTSDRRIELRYASSVVNGVVQKGYACRVAPFSKLVVRNLTLPEQGLGLEMDEVILWDNSIDVFVPDKIDWGGGLDAITIDNIDFDNGTTIKRNN